MGTFDDLGLPDEPFLRSWVRNSVTRTSMVREMGREPGVHVSELARRAEVHSSTLVHHLEAMEHKGLAETEPAVRGSQRLCFLVSDKGLWEKEERWRVLFGGGNLKHVAKFIVEHTAYTIQEISEEMGLEEHIVRYHVETLLEEGLVRREPVSRAYGYEALPVLVAWSEEVGGIYGRPWEEAAEGVDDGA